MITALSFSYLPPAACQRATTTELQAPKTKTGGKLSDDAVSAGWISLFDGESLFGFKSQSKVDWQVIDGAIVATTGREGLLRTTSQFSDFHLFLQYRAGAKTNSGVFVRTSPRPQKLTADCFEINIAPANNPFPTGGIVGRQRALISVAERTERWNQMQIVCTGNTVKVWVNGSRVNELQSSNPGRGFIGLQFNKGKIAFKNIFLRPLNLTPVFNRENLDGWDDSQKGASSFEVTAAGDLKMTSGRGQLESKKRFGDFVLQASCKTNAAGLNSGIFFRSVPGDLTNGYESQIQNEVLDGDPTQPVDCGTGGIFRRCNARRVNAQDMAWFTKTIVAVGPHFSVWVNGYQVTDWTDKRKPHSNPRKGLRLEAGSIILQGHDPTTDVLFGSINARELSPRRN
jgi:hypothetical protein